MGVRDQSPGVVNRVPWATARKRPAQGILHLPSTLRVNSVMVPRAGPVCLLWASPHWPTRTRKAGPKVTSRAGPSWMLACGDQDGRSQAELGPPWKAAAGSGLLVGSAAGLSASSSGQFSRSLPWPCPAVSSSGEHQSRCHRQLSPVRWQVSPVPSKGSHSWAVPTWNTGQSCFPEWPWQPARCCLKLSNEAF